MLLKLMYSQQQIIHVQLNSIFSWMQLTSNRLSHLERLIHELPAQGSASSIDAGATGGAPESASAPAHPTESTSTTASGRAKVEVCRQHDDTRVHVVTSRCGGVGGIAALDQQSGKAASSRACSDSHVPVNLTAFDKSACDVSAAETTNAVTSHSQHAPNSSFCEPPRQQQSELNEELTTTTSMCNRGPRSCTPSQSRVGRHDAHEGVSSDAVLNHSVDSLAAPWDPRNRLPGQVTSLRSSRTGSQLGRQDNPLLTGTRQPHQRLHVQQQQTQQQQNDSDYHHHSSGSTTQADGQARSLHSTISLATSGRVIVHGDTVTDVPRPSRRHSSTLHSASYDSSPHMDNHGTNSHRAHYRPSTNRLRSVTNNSSSTNNVHGDGGSGYVNDTTVPGSSSSTLVSSLRYAEREVPPYLRVATSGAVRKCNASKNRMNSSTGLTVHNSNNYVDAARPVDSALMQTGPQKVSALLTRKTVNAAVGSTAAVPHVSVAAVDAVQPDRHAKGMKRHEQRQPKSTHVARRNARDENGGVASSSSVVWTQEESPSGLATRHVSTGRTLDNVTHDKVEGEQSLVSGRPLHERGEGGAVDIDTDRTKKYRANADTGKNDDERCTATHSIASPLPLRGDPFKGRELHRHGYIHDGDDEVAATADCPEAFSYDSLSDGYGSYESKQYLKGIGLL